MEIEFRCSIHAIDFGVNWNGHKPEDAYMQCPLCAQREYKALAKICVEAEMHRNMLLECIDLKLAVRTLTNNEEKANGGG